MQNLDKFKKALPSHMYCTNDFRFGLDMRNKNHAIRHKYIQPNHKNSKKFFSFDIDYGISPGMFHDEFNLPEPNLFIQNRENCHAHVIYEIDEAVHLNENSSAAAIRYAAAIESAYKETLRADPG